MRHQRRVLASTARKKPTPTLPPSPPASRFGRKRKVKVVFGDNGEQEGPASKFYSAPPPPRAVVSVADEVAIPGWCTVGARVKALGWHAGGQKRFDAKVTGIRARFPRLVIQYLADEHGATHALALPTPRSAYVHAGMVQPTE